MFIRTATIPAAKLTHPNVGGDTFTAICCCVCRSTSLYLYHTYVTGVIIRLLHLDKYGIRKQQSLITNTPFMKDAVGKNVILKPKNNLCECKDACVQLERVQEERTRRCTLNE
jgi:hypothetical protein